MNPSQLHNATDLTNLTPPSGRMDRPQTSHPPACSDAAVQYVLQSQELLPAGSSRHSFSRQEDDLFFNLSSDLLSVASFDGMLERVNPAWTRCTGWSATELTSRPWLDFVHPDDHAATLRVSEALIEEGQAIHGFENRYLCKDGSFRRLSWNVQTLAETRQLLGVAQDVTQRRLDEELLKKNEGRYRLMVEGSAQVVFFTRDSAHCLTYLSPSVAHVLGYRPEELVGTSYRSLLMAHNRLDINAQALLIKSLQDEDGLPSRSYTAAVRHQDGRCVVLEIAENRLFEDNKTVGFQCCARDVTERLNAQNELALSKTRFRSAFKQAAFGTVILSVNGEFIRVNQSFADLLGSTTQAIAGQFSEPMTHPEDRRHDATSFARLIDGQTSSLMLEKRYLRSDGSSVWCQIGFSLLTLEGQKSPQFVGVVKDISDRKRVMENLEHGQAMLRGVGNLAKFGGWRFELAGKVLQWSEEVRAIHEVTPGFEPTLAQAIGYYPQACRAQIADYVSRCIADGTPFHFEHELITATGRRIWVAAFGEAVRDDQGTIVAVQGTFQDISARKQMEASLEASQHRFREMANTFPFIVWTANPVGSVDYANATFNTYVGVDQDAIPSVDWTLLVHPEDLPHCLQAWQTSIRTGGAYSIDYRLKEAASGDYRWFRVQAQPVRDAAGLIVKWYGSSIDINDTKLLEQQAKSLASRLSTTLESITDGFLIFDKNWTHTFLNTQAERMLDRNREDLLGKTLWLEFPFMVGSAFEQQYRKAVEENVPVHFEDYYPAPLDRWFAVSAYPSDEGLAVYFRDVSQTHKDLAQLQLLKTAVSRLNDNIVITEAEPVDGSGPQIIFVNEAFEKNTGYTMAEVIGKTPRILQGPKTQRAELDRISQALKTWQGVRAEVINYTKDGKEVWLELDIAPIANSSGWYTHWVAVGRDTTERKLAEQAILQLNNELEDRVHQRTQQLEEANKELAAFSYSVSHDLRSPLATINGFSQLLLKSDKEQLSEKSRHYLRRIYAGSIKMGELIEGLLSLARLSRGELNRREVDLTAMSSRMVQELRDAEPDRVVDVAVQPDLMVNGDAAMVTVVMQNLIANAWKYSSKTPLARVEIGSETAPDGVRCIFVRDNGAGFDMAYAEKLFQVFQRLHQDTEFTGTGIGLANVKRVVERHGGRLWAQAAVGEGATFRFTLYQAT